MLPENDNRFQTEMFQWSVRMSAVAVEMVVPAVLGILLDSFCGTVAVFTVAGSVLGVSLGFWQLIQIARQKEDSTYVIIRTD
jgi:F0F1-type ATP synthase assembly protein I